MMRAVTYNVKEVRQLKREFMTAACLFCIFLCGCGRRGIVYQTKAVEPSEDLYDNVAAADESVMEDDDSKAVQTADDREQVFPDRNEEPAEAAGELGCYVYVCGAVHVPGVYRMEEGQRLCDAVALAGGMTDDAEATSLNLAADISDGMMLVVPTRQEWEAGIFVTGADGIPVRKQNPASDEGVMAGEKSSADDGLVNINEATADQLCTLPGIGKTKAESIVSYRQEHGSFGSIDEIQRVNGIKKALYEKIKNKIKV